MIMNEEKLRYVRKDIKNGKYDYIVPIGVEIRKEAAGRAVIVTNFQQDKIAEYKNKKPEELVKLYAAICDKIEYLEKMQKTTEV